MTWWGVKMSSWGSKRVSGVEIGVVEGRDAWLGSKPVLGIEMCG